MLLSGLVAASLLGSAGAAMADSRGGSSESNENQTLACDGSYGAQPNGTYEEAPGAGECTNGATTYSGTVWTNDVDCGTSSAPVGQDEAGLAVIGGGEPSATEGWGEAELCSDGALPINGRVMVGGSFEEGGFHATADGDKSNTQAEQLQGWATVSATTDGPAVTCGDDAGHGDSTAPTAADGQDDCG